MPYPSLPTNPGASPPPRGIYAPDELAAARATLAEVLGPSQAPVAAAPTVQPQTGLAQLLAQPQVLAQVGELVNLLTKPKQVSMPPIFGLSQEHVLERSRIEAEQGAQQQEEKLQRDKMVQQAMEAEKGRAQEIKLEELRAKNAEATTKLGLRGKMAADVIQGERGYQQALALQEGEQAWKAIQSQLDRESHLAITNAARAATGNDGTARALLGFYAANLNEGYTHMTALGNAVNSLVAIGVMSPDDGALVIGALNAMDQEGLPPGALPPEGLPPGAPPIVGSLRRDKDGKTSLGLFGGLKRSVTKMVERVGTPQKTSLLPAGLSKSRATGAPVATLMPRTPVPSVEAPTTEIPFNALPLSLPLSPDGTPLPPIIPPVPYYNRRR